MSYATRSIGTLSNAKSQHHHWMLEPEEGGRLEQLSGPRPISIARQNHFHLPRPDHPWFKYVKSRDQLSSSSEAGGLFVDPSRCHLTRQSGTPSPRIHRDNLDPPPRPPGPFPGKCSVLAAAQPASRHHPGLGKPGLVLGGGRGGDLGLFHRAANHVPPRAGWPFL